MRTQPATKKMEDALRALNRQALFLGTPLTVSLGFALSNLVARTCADPMLSTGLSFYVVISIALMWFTHKRHEISRKALRNMAAENAVLREKLVSKRASANFDGLTGVPNIQMLPDRFNQAVARAHRTKTSLGLVTVTLDDFRHIHKRYGAQASERVIKSTCERIQSTMRQTDTVVRVGNCDFVILAEAVTDAEQLQAVKTKLLAALGKSIEVNNTTLIRAHEKVGSSMFPADGIQLEALLKKSRAELQFAPAPQTSQKRKAAAPVANPYSRMRDAIPQS